jgi:hypothetical protein
MSTIAFDGKRLVSDSSISVDNTISQTPFRKIFTPDDEGEYWEICGVKALAFATVGLPLSARELRKALQKGLDEDTDTSCFTEQFDAIVIDENGVAYQLVCCSKNKGGQEIMQIHFIPTTGMVAIGSGEQYATAVMSVGKSARSAIKVAIALNIDTAGNLQVFEVPPPPETPSKRPVPFETTEETLAKLDKLVAEETKDEIVAKLDQVEKQLDEIESMMS